MSVTAPTAAALEHVALAADTSLWMSMTLRGFVVREDVPLSHFLLESGRAIGQGIDERLATNRHIRDVDKGAIGTSNNASAMPGRSLSQRAPSRPTMRRSRLREGDLGGSGFRRCRGARMLKVEAEHGGVALGRARG